MNVVERLYLIRGLARIVELLKTSKNGVERVELVLAALRYENRLHEIDADRITPYQIFSKNVYAPYKDALRGIYTSGKWWRVIPKKTSAEKRTGFVQAAKYLEAVSDGRQDKIDVHGVSTFYSKEVCELFRKLAKCEGIKLPSVYGEIEDIIKADKLREEEERGQQSIDDANLAQKALAEKTYKQSTDNFRKSFGKTPAPTMCPEKLCGRKKGPPMDHEAANLQRSNPKYWRGGAYQTNCQSCVVCYELRRRGLDLQTKANRAGSTLRLLSRSWVSAWIDPMTGQPPMPIIAEGVRTPLDVYKWMDSVIKDNERYVLRVAWQSENSGHVVIAMRKNGNVVIYDPQPGKLYEYQTSIIEKFLKRACCSIFSTKGVPAMIRCDNLMVDANVVAEILTNR